MEEIRKKARELEAFADILEMIEDRIKWYQHTDEQTGELVDDTGEYNTAHLSALRTTAKAVKKLAGV